jgi:hypothetical protein
MTEREDDDEEESQVVRKGDDAKAHKELNKLGGDMDGEKEVDTGKAQDALTKLAASGQYYVMRVCTLHTQRVIVHERGLGG